LIPSYTPAFPAENPFTSAFWKILSGEVTGSIFPPTQNTLTTRENYLFF
jgi:hypothetical protein